MPYLTIDDFQKGLDTRRMPATTPAGALIVAEDGHITRGGEFEKRKAWIEEIDLTAIMDVTTDGKGLYMEDGGIATIFGTHFAPGQPMENVQYCQLVKNDGTAITDDVNEVIDVDRFGQGLHIIADVGGAIQHYVTTGKDSATTFWLPAKEVNYFAGVRAYCPFRVDGSSGTITSIKVAGVEILGKTLTLLSGSTTDRNKLAQQIATQINQKLSSPDYTAAKTGTASPIVTIYSTLLGANQNGKAVTFVKTGTVTLTFAWPVTAPSNLTRGGSDVGRAAGRYAKTYGDKMYAPSGAILYFSKVNDATKWDPAVPDTGAGSIDIATKSRARQVVTSMAEYYTNVAVFTPETIFIWYLDVDPAKNALIQVLDNVGTNASRSVTQFGDADVFFLEHSGIRSLRARANTNAAYTTDIGTAIDTIVQQYLATLLDSQVNRAWGTIEPQDGRFMLFVGQKVFVYSFFSSSKISAWSIYNLPFDVEHIWTTSQAIYFRSGEKIYSYGGIEGDQFDATAAKLQIPFLDANKPATKKKFYGIDAAVEGSWVTKIAQDPNLPATFDTLGNISEVTYPRDQIGIDCETTHISVYMESVGVGQAKVGKISVHYNETEEAR